MPTLTPSIRVHWYDTIKHSDGREEPGLEGWNQLQNTFCTLLAMLLKSDASISGAGITYLAVGEGLSAWDTTPPTLAKSDTTLETETFRKAITPATDIAYISALGGSVSGSATRFIRITVSLGTGDANGDLREWGLFGGSASGTADSGEMVDWVSHGRIVKDSSMTITRTIEFEIGLP